MSNLNKHLLLFLAVLFILVLIPTSFANNIDDASVVEVNNQLAVDDISQSATNDVAVESVSQSAADDKESVSDDSDALEANGYETDVITAGNDVTYVDGFDGSGGSGTSGNPYHSLKNVLTNSVNSGNEIYLLPGTYNFANTTIQLYDKDFTLNAMGDVIFTSSKTLFNKTGTDVLTLNGIQFKDITSSSSAILYTGSSVEGTLIFNDCTFINNKGANLVDTSYNIYIKGCTFIDNEATGTTTVDGGLIDNIFGSPVINISYSVFIGNKIRYSNNGFSPIIVNGIGDPGPSVYFDYNFVNDNNPLTQDEIIANRGVLNSYSNVNLAVTVPSDVPAGDTVYLVANFTKSDGSALNDYMPNLDVAFVPNVNIGSISVTITNNGGKGQYTADNRGYTEIVDVKCGEHVLNTLEFYVSEGNLLDPELTVPESLIVDMGATVNINPASMSDGALSYVSANKSVVTVNSNGIVTGVGEGITTITVSIAATDTYGEDNKQVTLMVRNPADANVIYVDGFDESDGGSGIKVDPYHSLKNVLVSENSGKEIRLLPGTYDFASTVDLKNNAFVLNAVGDDVIFTTSQDYMFKVNEACTVTFNGIRFEDSKVDGSIITRTFSSAIGTLNFYNCDFVNNTGDCLIKSSCNVNIKGCTFVDNKLTGTGLSNAGLIHNYYASTNTISISYSIFINNEIAYSNNGYNPIVVDWNNGNGPSVVFNYNFVNDNNDINNNAIAYHARITKGDRAIITGSAPSYASAGRTIDLVVKFTKSNGNPLDDKMADLDVVLVPAVNSTSIPVTITNNGGKGKYTALVQNPYYETVTVKVNDNDVTTFGFNVNRFTYIYPTIEADDLVMDYKDGSKLFVKLLDDYNNPISKALIYVNNTVTLYKYRTNAEGIAEVPVNLKPGQYTYNIYFEGNYTYKPANAVKTVVVNKGDVFIHVEDVTVTYKENEYYNVSVVDINNNPVSGVTVKVDNGAKVLKYRTGSDGIANVPVTLKPGEYTFDVSFDGNALYKASSNSSAVVVNKANVNIDALNLVVCYKDGSSFTATLTDANGEAISGATVKFNSGVNSYRYHTDSNGVASAPVKLKPGTYTYVISFAGNSLYAPANITRTLTVEKGTSNLEASNTEISYKNGNLTARLTDAEGNAIVGATVKFTNGASTYRYHTDSNGVATAPINVKPDEYDYTISFDGNSLYGAANTTEKVVVNKVDAVLTADDVSMTFKDGTNYTAKLTDINGNAIAGVIVKVNNTVGVYKYKTDSEGMIHVPVNLRLGEYAFTAFIDSSDIYNPCNVTSTVVITR